jgi:hypothetical protein
MNLKLFSWYSSLELNIKKLGNFPSFSSVTYSALSDKWFRSYRILKINFTSEFYFWIEQRLNGTELFGSWIDQNSGSPKYSYGRKFCHLSDGP